MLTKKEIGAGGERNDTRIFYNFDFFVKGCPTKIKMY